MIGNPIITKELVSALRSRGAVVLAVVFVAVLSLLALAIWPRSGINPTGALLSRLFFAVILVAQLAMLGLFSPPFSATSITGEREQNTWEMLYYSLLRPDEILVGKLVGAVAFLLVLVALSLPVGASCFLLGGVSPAEMFRAYLVLLMAGLTFGLVGLTCSALLRSSFSSLIVTYLALLALCGGTHMPMLLLPEWRAGQAALHAARCLSPFSALVAITHSSAFASMPGNAAQGVVARYFSYSAMLAAVCALVLLVRIAMRPERRVPKRKSVIDEATPLATRIMRRVFFLIDPRRRHGSIASWVNPVFVLDLRTRTAGIGNLLRATFACFIFAFGLVIMVSGTWGAARPDVIRLIALSFQMGLIALIGPSLTVGAVASEIEARTFDHLRMTPLRPWTIFWGKFMAAATLSLMLVVASAPVVLAIQCIQQTDERNLLKAMLANPGHLKAMFSIIAAMILFTLSSGLFFSSMCRTTARAAAWAYGLVSFVVVGSLLGLVLRDRLSEPLMRLILAFNPIVAVVGSVSEQQFAEFGRWQNNVLALGVLSAALIVGAILRLHRAAGPQE
jgi:ABC-type transport system involved in multi-copper enzyme maturation permease subunit